MARSGSAAGFLTLVLVYKPVRLTRLDVKPKPLYEGGSTPVPALAVEYREPTPWRYSVRVRGYLF